MSSLCEINRKKFCYVCGELAIQKTRKSRFESTFKEAYETFFESKMDEDVKWAPPYCCSGCYTGLTKWYLGKRDWKKFDFPTIWTIQMDHSNCHFCLSQTNGLQSATRSGKKRPKISSPTRFIYYFGPYAKAPTPWSGGRTIPSPPPRIKFCENEEEEESEEDFVDEEEEELIAKKPKLLNQEEMDSFLSNSVGNPSIRTGKYSKVAIKF